MSKRAPLLPIFLIVLVDVLGLAFMYPLLQPYAESLHATAFEASLLVPIYAICQLVSGPLLGRISDRTGRRPMLLLSQAGTLLGFLLTARASALWMVFVARALDGSTAGNVSLAQAYVSDNTEPKDRAKALGLTIGIPFGVGFLFGPPVAGYLTRWGLPTPFYVAAFLSLTAMACTFFLLPPGQARAATEGTAGSSRLALIDWDAYADYFKRPILSGLLVQFLLYMLTFQTFTAGFALFAERTFHWKGRPFAPLETGIALGYGALLGIILQGLLIGRLVRRFGEARLIAWGFGTLLVGYVVLGASPLSTSSQALVLLLISSTILAFGNGVLRPALTSLVTQGAPRGEQGTVLGLTQSLSSVAAITAPALGGLLIDKGFLTAWSCVAGTIALFGLVGCRWGSSRAPALSQA